MLQEKFFYHSAMRLQYGACCSAGLWSVPHSTGRRSADVLKSQYRSWAPAWGYEAVRVLGGPARWAAAAWSGAMALMRPPSRTFFVTLTFWEVWGQWTCQKTFFFKCFQLCIESYYRSLSPSDFAGIPLERWAGFGCAVTNLQRNNRSLQWYSGHLAIRKGLFLGFGILGTLLIR